MLRSGFGPRGNTEQQRTGWAIFAIAFCASALMIVGVVLAEHESKKGHAETKPASIEAPR